MAFQAAGAVLDNLYRLERLLGVGGVGAVYAARHLLMGREVAIKVLHPQFAQNHEPLQRFQREAQLLGKLGHPSILKVYDFTYASDGTPYLVMELLHGETLRERLSRGPMPMGEVTAVFRPLCEALEQAHQLQILHRDLKPDNLILAPEGVKILDFGMAKLLSDENPLTAPKVVMGTPYYLAPERARGLPGVDHRSDIFALGALLYEMLTGRMAFAAETPLAAMYRIIQSPVPALNLPDAGLSRRLDAVIERACAKDPAARYDTAGALYSALEAALAAPSAGTGAQQQPVDTTPPVLPVRGGTGSQPRDAAEGVVKAGIFLGTVHYIRTRYGEDGYGRLREAMGPARMDALMAKLPIDWVSMSDLYDLHVALCKLFDDGSLGVMRDLGRFVATTTLETIYKAFLTPGNPATMVRRTQTMLTATVSGQSKVEEIGPRRWHMELSQMPGLTVYFMAAMVGWVQYYLERTGAQNVDVTGQVVGDGGAGDMYLAFDMPEAAAA